MVDLITIGTQFFLFFLASSYVEQIAWRFRLDQSSYSILASAEVKPQLTMIHGIVQRVVDMPIGLSIIGMLYSC
jgi:hypothetical protein